MPIPAKRPHGFPKGRRLLRSHEYRAVFDQQVRVSDGHLTVFGRSTAGPTRLGLAVSRKVGNAVVRNAWKRQLREAFRHCHAHLPVGLDLVVLVRPRTRPRRGVAARSLPALVRRLAKKLEGRRPS